MIIDGKLDVEAYYKRLTDFLERIVPNSKDSKSIDLETMCHLGALFAEESDLKKLDPEWIELPLDGWQVLDLRQSLDPKFEEGLLRLEESKAHYQCIAIEVDSNPMGSFDDYDKNKFIQREADKITSIHMGGPYDLVVSNGFFVAFNGIYPARQGYDRHYSEWHNRQPRKYKWSRNPAFIESEFDMDIQELKNIDWTIPEYNPYGFWESNVWSTEVLKNSYRATKPGGIHVHIDGPLIYPEWAKKMGFQVLLDAFPYRDVDYKEGERDLIGGRARKGKHTVTILRQPEKGDKK